jgi:hypothetical protein
MTAHEAKRGLKARAIHELVRFGIMFTYLWAMFLLFQIHEFAVLAEHHISFTKYGFGFVNALVLAKVMLIADDLRLGRGSSQDRLSIQSCSGRVSLPCSSSPSTSVKKVPLGAFHGKGLADSVPTYGGGGLLGSVLVGVIITFSLLPFFAFQELSRAMRAGELAQVPVGRNVARQPGQSKPCRGL